MKTIVTHIFPDDTMLDNTQHVTRVMGQVRKLPEPVLAADCPTDRFGVHWASVIYDTDENCFKAWYMAIAEKQRKWVGDPLLCDHAPQYCGYATSTDGVNWEKPDLGLVEFNGSKSNNLCDSVHCDGVLKDQHDPDPSRRYKRFMYDSMNKALHMLFSPDGIHWTWPTREAPLFKGWDIIHDSHTFMGWDDKHEKYVAFLRPPVDINPLHKRTIGISMTDDVLNWPPPKIILQADDFDGMWLNNRASPVGADLYVMQGFRYGEYYMGLVSVFEGQFSHEFNDPVYIGLASSHDLMHWQRPLRSRFLCTGNPGEYDAGAVYVFSPPIEHKDELLVYYTAMPHPHAGHCPAHTAARTDMYSSLGLARLRLDGFCGLYTNPYPGRIVTKPLTFHGNKILVNHTADKAAGGWIKMELQDESGKPIHGFTMDECRPMREDALYDEVTWNDNPDIRALEGRSVKIAIQQTDNVLYAIRFAEK